MLLCLLMSMIVRPRARLLQDSSSFHMSCRELTSASRPRSSSRAETSEWPAESRCQPDRSPSRQCDVTGRTSKHGRAFSKMSRCIVSHIHSGQHGSEGLQKPKEAPASHVSRSYGELVTTPAHTTEIFVVHSPFDSSRSEVDELWLAVLATMCKCALHSTGRGVVRS